EPLRGWNKEKLENIDAKIKLFEEEIAKTDTELEQKINEEDNVVRRGALRSQLEVWYKRRRADYWRQHSRDRYVKDVEKNTR
ncbi:hypothetical protein PIB30_084860, partial [Stylosanthes scabra]|nr:hypothetical protein [Stylosanthes scabra]